MSPRPGPQVGKFMLFVLVEVILAATMLSLYFVDFRVYAHGKFCDNVKMLALMSLF